MIWKNFEDRGCPTPYPRHIKKSIVISEKYGLPGLWIGIWPQNRPQSRGFANERKIDLSQNGLGSIFARADFFKNG